MVEVWPFIVARNPELDWRPIYAPDFLVQDKNDFMLVLQTGSAPHQESILTKTIDVRHRGRFTLAFRSRPASQMLRDTEGKDRFGRPIHVIEGLVVPGWHPIDEAGVERLLDAQQELTAELLGAFWGTSSEQALAVPSSAQELEPRKAAEVPATVGGLAFLGVRPQAVSNHPKKAPRWILTLVRVRMWTRMVVSQRKSGRAEGTIKNVIRLFR
ncbi:hypothetical protein [Arthrobacter sp. SAFR-044]|uniref:hypothetical protein n=1 Tax=Arthrobacter sp. SAFR-044 TaxID=3387278 RepID=UPI003F7BEDCA